MRFSNVCKHDIVSILENFVAINFFFQDVPRLLALRANAGEGAQLQKLPALKELAQLKL